jgi:hypothetical protein
MISIAAIEVIFISPLLPGSFRNQLNRSHTTSRRSALLSFTSEQPGQPRNVHGDPPVPSWRRPSPIRDPDH